MDEIIDRHSDLDHDVASAFILGCIATELHWLRMHEAAVVEGYAHVEGRENRHKYDPTSPGSNSEIDWRAPFSAALEACVTAVV